MTVHVNIYTAYKKFFVFLAAATIKFNGVNSLSLRYPAGLTNEADDITIRFRTIEQSGLLLTTRHDRSQDKLELSLESARVRVTLQVIDFAYQVSISTTFHEQLLHAKIPKAQKIQCNCN